MFQAIVRRFSVRANLLALMLVASVIAMAGCAGDVMSEEEELAELGLSTEALVPSSPHWVRTCKKAPSGPLCEASSCVAGQYLACWGGSCSCQVGSVPDHDGSRYCLADEHIECSDRGTGMGCYCARGLPPLLPQKPLAATPLELAATKSDDVEATFARFDDGSVWGWGTGSVIPGSSGGDVIKPVRVELNGKVTRITAGARTACALMQDGKVKCWGNFAVFDWPTPMAITNEDGVELSGFIGLTHGEDHACAFRADGRTFCWGDSSYRRFGDATCGIYESAFEVEAVTDAAQVVASAFNTCFLRKNGLVACVGVSHLGQLGTGALDDPDRLPNAECWKNAPRDSCAGTAVAEDIPGLSHVVLLSGGGTGSFCAETKSGTKCWGANDYGRLALPLASGVTQCFSATAINTPRSEGPYHVFGPGNSCIYTARGRVSCWGSRANGVLLDGGAAGREMAPKALPFAQDVTSLALGATHGCYAGQGVIRCWGNGDGGRLGNGGTTSFKSTMVSVEDFAVTPAPIGSTVASLNLLGTNTTGAGCGLYDTGIDVYGGHPFKVSATGTWALGPGPSYLCSASGTTTFGKSPEGFDYGSLLGRIGTGPLFMVGASATKTLSFGGRLWLGMADTDCANNGGALSVTVTQ